MTDHTPGPWFAVRNRMDGRLGNIAYTVFDGRNRRIATCAWHDTNDEEFPLGSDAAEANARLIAAAPELLEALREQPCWLRANKGKDDVYWDENCGSEDCPRCAAMAKATQP